MFGTSNAFGPRPNSIFSSGTANASQNPLNDIEVGLAIIQYIFDKVYINLTTERYSDIGKGFGKGRYQFLKCCVFLGAVTS